MEVLVLAVVLLLTPSMHPPLLRVVPHVTAAARGAATRGAATTSTDWKICEGLEGLVRPWHLPPGGHAAAPLGLGETLLRRTSRGTRSWRSCSTGPGPLAPVVLVCIGILLDLVSLTKSSVWSVWRAKRPFPGVRRYLEEILRGRVWDSPVLAKALMDRGHEDLDLLRRQPVDVRDFLHDGPEGLEVPEGRRGTGGT